MLLKRSIWPPSGVLVVGMPQQGACDIIVAFEDQDGVLSLQV